jgi:hypothetical protein
MLVIAGCSASGTPATVPPSTPATASTVAASTTAPPTTTTTTTHATTTTVDRLAEIEAIFQDLEERRLQALYEGDEETFKSLFANEEYMQRSLGAFAVMEFEGPPEVRINGLETVHDGELCLAARYRLDRLDRGDTSSSTIVVVEQGGDGWGFSYAGEGWACDGPHPFSP